MCVVELSNGETLRVTPEHRFYTNGKWVEIDELEIGDLLQTKENVYLIIENKAIITTLAEVFNLEIEGNENYFVTQDGILVHNGYKYDDTKPDPEGTYRDNNDRLRDSETNRFVKDPNRIPSDDYQRNMESRREALLRDAKDPNSGLSQEARDYILKHKGNRVPPGYEVSHEQPLYTASSNESKTSLDTADNMKTQPTDVHRERHMVCGDQYHEFGPANKPHQDKMID